jgi:serine/threonine protein kinase/WD40 repeat protein
MRAPTRSAPVDGSDAALNAMVEEMASRLQAGDPVDLDAIARHDPERVELLRQILPAIEMMAELGRSLVRDAARSEPSAGEHAHLGELGDYRIVREIGRGGMGIVYEAEQVSLGRRVALKVLPFATAVDPKQLARFHIEAQAAAHLHHTNIVPIHAVGCEKGLNFYAMQYIDGPSLAAVIRALRRRNGLEAPERSPAEPDCAGDLAADMVSGRFAPPRPEAGTVEDQTSAGSHAPRTVPRPSRPAESPPETRPSPGRPYFRAVAHLGMQAAEALEHAHQLGVVHRDVKPGNLLVDVRGNLWVTDFGLARMQDGSDLTMTGDLLGTLRYMSPEQALAKRVAVDYRTDIYSLGATVYELLTLEPAFDGRDRQEVLRRIAFEESRRPRRIDPMIPRELETIVLKAMSKEPNGRYGSAQELADDLRRFLDDKPIRARRPAPVERLGKWSRRHQVAVLAAFVILLITSAASAIGAVLIARERGLAMAAARQSRYESLMQRLLRIRLTPHTSGWSVEASALIRRAAESRPGDAALRDQAAATLIGADARRIKTMETPASSIAFDPEGRRLLMADPSGKLRIWDRETDRTEVLDLASNGPVVFASRADGSPLLLSPTGRGEGGRAVLRLWDVTRRRVIREFAIPGGVGAELRAQTLSPEGVLVGALTVAPDGASRVTVWEAESGKVLRTIPYRALGLAFSPDAALLAAWDRDGNMTVWSLPDAAPIATLSAGHSPIQCVSLRRARSRASRPGLAGSGWLVAAGDAGGTVTVWDLGTKLPRTFCRGSHYGVNAVAFHPDGATLASAGRGTVKIWDLAHGRLLLNVGDRNTISALSFSADGRRLAVGSENAFWPGGVDVWDLEDGRGLATLRGLQGQVSKVRYSPDGRLLAALSHDWQVAVWDVETGRLRRTLEPSPGEFADNAGFAFDAAGRRLAFAAGTGAALWDLDSGEQLKSWPLPIGFNDHLAFHAKGRLLLFRVETPDPAVRPYDKTDHRRYPRIGVIRDLLASEPLTPVATIDAFSRHVYFSAAAPDGSTFVVEGLGGPEGKDRTVRAFDWPTGAERWSIASQKTADHGLIAIDPTGKLAAVHVDGSDRRDGALVELATGRLLGPLRGGALCLAPDAEYFGGTTLRRRADDTPLVRLGIDTEATSVAPSFDPSGRHLAWGNSDGTVTVCDLRAVGRRLAELGLGW